MEAPLELVARQILGILPEDADDARFTLTAGELRHALQQAFDHGRSSAEPVSAEAQRESNYFRQLMNSLPDFVYFKDRESRFVCVNRAHAERMGLANPADAVGKSDFDFFQRDDAEHKFAEEQEIVRTGKGFPPKVERDYNRGGEYWALSTKHPLRDANGEICGTFGLSRDVSAEIDAKEDLAEQHRLLETLINVLPCRIFVRDREHRFQLINEEYRRSLQIADPRQIIGQRFDELLQDDRVDRLHEEDATIMQTGQSILRRVEFDTSPLDHGRWLSVSKVPLRSNDGEIEGIVGVSFDITSEKEAEARATEFGRALKRKNEQMESELSLARKLQRALATFRFPGQIRLAGNTTVQAAYLYEPSEHVAGDFFQIYKIDAQRFGVFICDVMGHGVRSALVTAVIRGLLEEKRAGLVEPERLFRELNQVFFRLGEDPDFPRFVTAMFALFDTAKSQVKIVCAGHPPAIAVTTEGGKTHAHKLSQQRDPALGLVDDYPFRTAIHPLRDDTLFLLYTDGIVEEQDARGHEFGIDGLAACLEEFGQPTAQQVITLLRKRLSEHSSHEHFSDDVCAVALSLVRGDD